jgi:hypothetical protein
MELKKSLMQIDITFQVLDIKLNWVDIYQVVPKVRDETLEHENLVVANQEEEQPELEDQSINPDYTSFEPTPQDTSKPMFSKLESLSELADQVDVGKAPIEGIPLVGHIEEDLYDASEPENEHQDRVGNSGQQNMSATMINHESQDEINGKSNRLSSTPELGEIQKNETPISNTREKKFGAEVLVSNLESSGLNTPRDQNQGKEAILSSGSDVSKDMEVEDQRTSSGSKRDRRRRSSRSRQPKEKNESDRKSEDGANTKPNVIQGYEASGTAIQASKAHRSFASGEPVNPRPERNFDFEQGEDDESDGESEDGANAKPNNTQWNEVAFDSATIMSISDMSTAYASIHNYFTIRLQSSCGS